MKIFTLTIALTLLTIVSMTAQRGGSYNTTAQRPMTSMATLNTGNNSNSSLRPNHNVNNNDQRHYNNGHHHTTNHHAGHGHHNHHGQHAGHGHHNHYGHGHHTTTTHVVHHVTPAPVPVAVHTCSHGGSCSFGCGGHVYSHTPVCGDAFLGWLDMLSLQRNSAVRYRIAMDYIQHNWLTTHQVYDILGLFCNESSKMMLAEAAYPHICDQQYYYRLYNCFSNSACVLHLQSIAAGY